MSEYKIKGVSFLGKPCSILLQNENGPCPLLAIANILLLRQNMSINPDLGHITFEDLITRVSNVLLDLEPGHPSEDDGTASKQALNINDSIEMLPKLNVGLDVNINFSTCDGFEATPELALFKVFGIGLYHGWTVSEQEEAAERLFPLSYNQAMEKLIEFECKQQAWLDGDDTADLSSDLAMKDWLDGNPSQLTYDGLLQLHEKVVPDQLCVFFRNNHFATMFKRKTGGENRLYLLATDVAFSDSPVVWEMLQEVDGDNSGWFDSNFQPYEEVIIPPEPVRKEAPPKPKPAPRRPAPTQKEFKKDKKCTVQ